MTNEESLLNEFPLDRLTNALKSQMGRDHWEDQDVDGWTILKWILER
jgi:hypothetical protein